MENQPKLNNSKEIIAYLAEKFPLCFVLEGEAKPLKIGIFQDLAERLKDDAAVSKTQLRTALRLYTSSWRYLHGVRVGAQRIDLDGQTCGVLDEEHVVHARQQLETAKAKVKAIRAEQQEKQKKSSAPKSKPPVKATKKSNIVKPQKRIDISKLQVGQNIKVSIGKSAVDATILEIAKDGVRVQIPSGLAMIVRAEHLVI